MSNLLEDRYDKLLNNKFFNVKDLEDKGRVQFFPRLIDLSGNKMGGSSGDDTLEVLKYENQYYFLNKAFI